MKLLSVDKCTKQQCDRCDFGYIISNYIKPIMQCLTMDIKEYYMRLLTTKCLNSAVLVAYFMLGKRGIDIANFCDTHKVRDRHSEGKCNNVDLLDKLQIQLLHPICKYRQLYYILITDTEFPHPDGVNRHFPGHVFIIEKIPAKNGQKPSYYFHQSYINQYDYAGHIKRNNGSLELTWDNVKRMVEQIRYVILNPTWDENSVKAWKDITFVNTKKMLGAQSQGKMFLCFKRSKVSDCIGRLESYTVKKLREIGKLKMDKMNEIYGDKTAYDENQKPLTNIKMKEELERLHADIKNSKTPRI